MTQRVENWLPINLDIFCNAYEVSDLGRVRRIITGTGTSRQPGAILTPNLDTSKYYKITLSYGIRKNILVYVAVALTFIPNPNNFPQVNHIDRDKLNNLAENLEWCDNQYNQKYSIYHSAATGGQLKLSLSDAQEIKRLRQEGMDYVKIADLFHVSKTAVYKICTGKAWTGI